MEKALLKLARQLASYDEASLMALWEKYAAITREFEPSRRWEEGVLVFGLIQSMRWKNQLFNHHWSSGRLPAEAAHSREAQGSSLAFLSDDGPEPELVTTDGPLATPSCADDSRARRKVLRLRPKSDPADD